MPSQIPSIYSKEVMDYWQRRGIDYRICIKERIFEYAFGRDRKPILGFPVYINMTLVNVKYLDVRWQPEQESPKWWQLGKEYGTKILPWGLQSLQFEPEKPKIVIWTEGECFTGDTEILTRNGWIKFSEYQGDEVMQVHYGDNFVGSFVTPLGLVKSKTSEFIHLHSKNYNSLTTIGHKIILKKRKGNIFKETAETVFNTIYSDIIPLTLKQVIGNPGVPFSDDELRLIVAISADMTIRATGDVYGAFKKDRKKVRLSEILCQLDIPYSCTKDMRDYWSIFINRVFTSKYRIKEFPQEWIGKLTHSQMMVILDEILYWDGNSVPNRAQIEYSSVIYNNAVFIQTLAHLCGYTSTIIRRHNDIGSWYKVSILFKKSHVCADRSLKREKIKLDTLKKVYCVEVPSGMILVRHNEKISISGNCDRLTWMTAGYKNIISEPQGAPNPEAKEFKEKFAYMEDPYFKSVMADVDMIIFSTDNDAPGKVLRNHLALLFGKEKCKYINYPVGYKDINEVWKGEPKKNLMELGQSGVDECYHNLSSFPLKGIVRPVDVREELEAIAANGFTPGYGIGIPDIDKLFTLKKKQFTVVTGIPNMGKSTWVRWYLSEFVIHNSKDNLKWALFTPENRPVAREQAKITEVLTKQSFRRGYNNSMTDDLRERTLRFVQKHFFCIAPNKLNFETWNGKIVPDRMNTIESLLQYIVYLKKTEDIFGFVIDAWNKIEHEQPKNITETSFISQQLDHLINFIDVYDLHLVLVAHPTKIEKVGINYRKPVMYDIKGSSAWFEKPDIGLTIHRYLYKKRPHAEIPDDATDDDKVMIDLDAPTIITNEKTRFEETGKLGRVKMGMDFYKGNSFYMIEDKKKGVSATTGKLNPAVKEDDDAFGEIPDEKELPF
jgi:hypothetical protein